MALVIYIFDKENQSSFFYIELILSRLHFFKRIKKPLPNPPLKGRE